MSMIRLKVPGKRLKVKDFDIAACQPDKAENIPEQYFYSVDSRCTASMVMSSDGGAS